MALESGVYVCKINDDCNVAEIRNNILDPENPFCHVIWNSSGILLPFVLSPSVLKLHMGFAGDSVICGKMSGEIQICDLRHPVRRIEWHLLAKQTLRSIALEQEHLLTW